MQHFYVGSIDDFNDKEKKVVIVENIEVGIFRLDDDFFAWKNICPHQGGPVCQGRMYPLVNEKLDKEKKSHGRTYNKTKINIVCPWHGLEFDIRTGKHPGNPSMALESCNIKIKRRDIYVLI